MAILLEDRTPVFVVQKRLGKNEEIFLMIKFRSIRVTPLVTNADGSALVDECDPRVTRVGTFLRRTSLDELRQLINVLLGLSLMGPRPDLPEHLWLYTDEERLKLVMRPGMTGLTQVMGRNDLPWKERIQIDIEYIRSYSLLLCERLGLS